MLKTRVIPILLLSNKALVKGVKFKNHKYVGDPINTVKIFNDKEVDELAILDISASISGKKPDFELLESIASEAFMPLAYGGGISTIEDAKKLFKMGFEKIILNTAAIENESLINKVATHFGAQSVVVCIDVKKGFFGKYNCYIKSGTKHVKYSPVELAKKFATLGVGEIIINSIDKDGTMSGYDLDLVREVSNAVSVPVIALGGVGKLSDFKEAVKIGASAVGAGSFFVYNGPHRAVLITYPNYADICNLFKD